MKPETSITNVASRRALIRSWPTPRATVTKRSRPASPTAVRQRCRTPAACSSRATTYRRPAAAFNTAKPAIHPAAETPRRHGRRLRLGRESDLCRSRIDGLDPGRALRPTAVGRQRRVPARVDVPGREWRHADLRLHLGRRSRRTKAADHGGRRRESVLPGLGHDGDGKPPRRLHLRRRQDSRCVQRGPGQTKLGA
jgi:hypothetical protein